MDLNKSQLQQMKNRDITQAEHSALADICGIRIDSSLPAAAKVQSFFDQVGDPYCFLCGDTPVRVRFVAEERSLKDALRTYFLSLK